MHAAAPFLYTALFLCFTAEPGFVVCDFVTQMFFISGVRIARKFINENAPQVNERLSKSRALSNSEKNETHQSQTALR